MLNIERNGAKSDDEPRSDDDREEKDNHVDTIQNVGQGNAFHDG